jgi:rhodanese-related sulfurtransferase
MLAFLPLVNDHRCGEGVRMTATAAPDQDAIAHFAARLRYETDPADVAAARAAGADLVLIDVRSQLAWDQGHVPGARHLPLAELEARVGELPAPQDDPHLVVYCWGPGCNGSTRGALALALVGYRRVQEMIGGFEYWAREGLAIQTAAGRSRRPVDVLTAPVPPAVG